MTGAPDHLLLCYSQPSLSAREEARFSAALSNAAQRVHAQAVTVVRLEGSEQGLAAALLAARDAGVRYLRVLPTGFPMAANIRAWLPGAVAHFAATEAEGMQIDLCEPPQAEDAAAALVALTTDVRARDALAATPTLGKPGWQFLPAFDTHILVCTGPRCAFRGAGTLQVRLKTLLAEGGVSDRCLTTTTGCLFPCNQGPLIAIYPAGDWFRVPDEAALARIVTDVIAAGGDAPDLRLAERPDCLRHTRTSPTPTRKTA